MGLFPVVLIDAGAVVANHPLRRIDDCSSRPVINLEGVNPGSRVMAAKIEDRTDIGGAKRVKRLVVVTELMFAKPTLMSLAQNGTSPHRITSRLRALALAP